MKTSGAAGGVNGADAKTLGCWRPTEPSSLASEKAVNTACAPGTGHHFDPSVYWTLSASCVPEPSCRPAYATSTAKLKSLTAEPVVGGVNDADMASTFLGSVGGHESLTTYAERGATNA